MSKKLLLNLACGQRKYADPSGDSEVVNIDINPDVSPDRIHDIKYGIPYCDDMVDEIICEHFIEHLDGIELIRFFNECWRVLKVDGKLIVRAPHKYHHNAFIDPTHKSFLFKRSFNFFIIQDYNSENAGVKGWYVPLSIEEKEDGELEGVFLKTLEPNKWMDKKND